MENCRVYYKYNNKPVFNQSTLMLTAVEMNLYTRSRDQAAQFVTYAVLEMFTTIESTVDKQKHSEVFWLK